MTTERITIDKHEDKTSQGGKDYTRFSTNLGWLSCFEDDVIKELKTLGDGNSIEIEMATSEKDGKTFKNIRNVYPNSKTNSPAVNTESKSTTETPVSRAPVKGTAYEKDPVGLTIDVYTSGQVSNIVEAIEIVKQAQKAFS